jgi:hypothetical protein
MTQVHQAEIVTPQETALAQRQQMGIEQTIGQSLEAQVRAGIEARYALAMRQPRDLDLVRQRVLKECRRPGFAQVARYAKPQGGGKVYGPTIRFVEAAIRCMTNVFHETTAIYEDQYRRVLRVSVTDLEANACHAVDVTVQKTVERSSGAGREVLGTRTNTQNKMVYIVACTEDELLVKQNAMLSKALRNLGLKLIPGDIVDEAQQLVVEVQEQTDKSDPEGARKKVFDGFADIGITPPEIKEYLGREAGPGDLVHLRALFQALRSGDVSWREVLQEKRDGEPGEASKTLADKLKAQEAKVKARAQATQNGAATPPSQIDAETMQRWQAAIAECSDKAGLDQVSEQMAKAIPVGTPGREPLDKAYLLKSAELKP